MIDLDNTDRLILRELIDDATQSASTIGRKLGLSQPATWRRIRRLQDSGVIKGQRLDLDHEKLGFGVTVFWGSNWQQRAGLAWMTLSALWPPSPKCKLLNTY